MPTSRASSATAVERATRGVRNRITELRFVRAGDLREHRKNWRRHPDRQRRVLQELLDEVGYADALVARVADDGMLELIDGHLRRNLDEDQVVPVLVVDVNEDEADLLLATLDPVTGLAGADPERVAELLASVHASGDAVRELLASIGRDALAAHGGLVDADDVPPPPSGPRTRLGDLWACGQNRVLCGDATDPEVVRRLVAGERPRALWTDPPYGVAYVGKTPQALTIANDAPDALALILRRAFAAADEVLEPGSALYVAHPAGQLSLVFAQAFVEAGWELRQTLVWVKDQMVLGHGDYHYRHEPILYGRKPGPGRWGRGHRGWCGGNAETSVFEIPRPRASREHPTAKPVELVRRCLANSTAHDSTVLDPFFGSGTTLIAAQQLDRRCFGLELDPVYVDVAVTRWERFTGERAQRL